VPPYSNPIATLLERLDGAGAKPRKSGRGWLCRCPAHEDRSASLSVAEGDDGRALLRCFAGCSAAAVVEALGITLADLFEQKPVDLSPLGRAQQREAHRQAGWAAALGVLAREGVVVEILAREMVQGRTPSAEDLSRVSLAMERIALAREVLA
jgi:hypothetical protein